MPAIDPHPRGAPGSTVHPMPVDDLIPAVKRTVRNAKMEMIVIARGKLTRSKKNRRKNCPDKSHQAPAPETEPMILTIGRNIAMTIVPTTTARTMIRAGSIAAVMPATALSTSSS